MIERVSETEGIIGSIKNAADEIYHSFDVDTPEKKKILYNATTSSEGTLKENVNKVIEVVDVVIMTVEVINDNGEKSLNARTTLITKDGKFLSATSWGIYNSVKRLMAIYGGLHFDPPLKVAPVEVKTKNGFTLNLKLV